MKDVTTISGRVRHPRHAWAAAGLVFVIAAVLQGLAVSLFWSVCATQGAMSEGCLTRMDSWPGLPAGADSGDPFGMSAFAALAAACAALGWLIVVLATRLTRAARILGLLVGAQVATAAGWTLLTTVTMVVDSDLPVSRLWWASGELLGLAFVAVLVVGNLSAPRVRLVIAVFAATTFGLLHTSGEVVLFMLSGYDWDIAPWTGLGSAATLLVGAAACWWPVRAAGTTPPSTDVPPERVLQLT